MDIFQCATLEHLGLFPQKVFNLYAEFLSGNISFGNSLSTCESRKTAFQGAVHKIKSYSIYINVWLGQCINMWLGRCMFVCNWHPNQCADLGDTLLTGGTWHGK